MFNINGGVVSWSSEFFYFCDQSASVFPLFE